MTLLKQETLFSVINAAIDAGLDCDALLLGIPRETQASIVKTSALSSRERYLSILSQLNDWRGHGRGEPPLRTLVHRMCFLANGHAHVFQKALAELDGVAPSGGEHAEFLFTRVKERYVERGYRVVPPVEAPISPTFQAWRSTGAVSIVGVAAVAPLAVVIESVKRAVEQLTPHERVEGCVVLSSHDVQDAEQVRNAGLLALYHKELARMGVREVTAFVDRQQAVLAREEAESGASEDDNEVFREVRAGLRERSVRVLVVRAPAVRDSARRIVLGLTREYLRDPARAAPLLLPFATDRSDFQELVASAFDERRVPFSRLDFPGLLAENAFLPVFTADSPQSVVDAETGDAAVRVVTKGAKVILVTAETEINAPQLAQRWGIRSHHVRTIAALPSPTRTTMPRESGSNPRPDDLAPSRVKSQPYLNVRIQVAGDKLLLGADSSDDANIVPEALAGLTLEGVQDFDATLRRLARNAQPLDAQTLKFAQRMRQSVYEVLGSLLARLSADGNAVLLRWFCSDPKLQQIPWEAMARPREESGFMAISNETLFTRAVHSDYRSVARVISGKVRVLVVAPEGKHDADRIERELGAAISRGEVEWLPPLIGERALRLLETLRSNPPHVLHFVGHGRVTPSAAILLGRDSSDEEVWLKAELLAQCILTDTKQFLRLAVLEACEGGAVGEFGSSAEALCRVGVDAVLAHLWPVASATAGRFTRSFYAALVEQREHQGDVGRAVNEARLAVLANCNGSAEAFSPVLYLRTRSSALFEMSPRTHG